jgi:N-methylhydantoinase B/oxoprolinase/acetone carboxylase alpha subunit
LYVAVSFHRSNGLNMPDGSGMHGGGDGARGRNTLLLRQSDGSLLELQLGAKNTYAAQIGDCVRVETPGGGGWGVASHSSSAESPTHFSSSRSELGSVEQYRLLQEQA